MWLVIKTNIVYYFIWVAFVFASIVGISILTYLNQRLGWGISWLNPLVPGFDGMTVSFSFIYQQSVVLGSLLFVVALVVFMYKKRAKFAAPWVVACVVSAIVAAISIANILQVAALDPPGQQYSEGKSGFIEAYSYDKAKLPDVWYVLAVAVPVAVGIGYYSLVQSRRNSKKGHL